VDAVGLLAGLVLLTVGAEGLVRGASGVAVRLGVTPVVVGLTVVAFGTSAPELAVGVDAARRGEAALALGNVVGSTIANVLLVLGVTAVASAAALRVDLRIVRIDVPVMIAAAVAVLALGIGGVIGRVEGGVLLGLVLVHASWTVWSAQRARAGVRAEFEEALDAEAAPAAVQVLMALAGLGLLAVGADVLVDAAESIAARLGVSDTVIGLTVVAVGTSAPELTTSIVAARRGEADLAVGNAVGSNILNLLLVLGATAVAAPGGVPVSSQMLRVDLPIMVAVCVACLPVFFKGACITRREGGAFVATYAAYLTFVVLDASDHALRDPLAVALGVAVPLALVSSLVIALREWAQR
jgi:cation:H+ antiporter